MHNPATTAVQPSAEADEGIRIVFLTAVFTSDGIEAGYAGGVDGFLADFPYARKARGLLALSSMSSGELMEMLDLAGSRCPGLSDCCAVADVFAGPLGRCDGIRFVRTGTDMLSPGWVAYPKDVADREDSGSRGSGGRPAPSLPRCRA